MAYPADFRAAHLRHWKDAELLFKHERWANADQLYGLSAECGLKAVMRTLGMSVGRHGIPTRRQHRQHVKALWPEFVALADGRGAGMYRKLLPKDEPFAGWSIEDRYAHGRHFSRTRVGQHRSAARAVRIMVQQVMVPRAPQERVQ